MNFREGTAPQAVQMGHSVAPSQRKQDSFVARLWFIGKQKSAETGGGIGARGKRFDRRRRVVRLDLGRRGLGDTNTLIAVQMLLGTSGAIAFAAVLVALAGEFVATANTIAVASFRRGLYGYEGHGMSPAKDNMRPGYRRNENDGCLRSKIL
jgi:hypothetical protein